MALCESKLRCKGYSSQFFLVYVVQGHRFNIFEGIGCYPAIYNTTLAVVLVDIWPLAIALVSSVYSGISIYSFIQRRARLNEFISSTTGFSLDYYYRLTALALVNILIDVPLCAYVLGMDIADGVYPWLGWADTHSDFSKVDLVPGVIWRADRRSVIGIETTRWFTVGVSMIFFALFGTSLQARARYRAILSIFRQRTETNGVQPDPRIPSAKAAILSFQNRRRRDPLDTLWSERSISSPTTSTPPSHEPLPEVSQHSQAEFEPPIFLNGLAESKEQLSEKESLC